MRINKKNIKKVQADILPLMDCMFILLIYFIFTLMLLVSTEVIPMKLPKIDEKDQSKLTYYSVVVLKGGDILFNKNKKSISIDSLRLELQALLDKDIKPKVFLETKPGSEFMYFVAVLDVFRELQIRSISIETDVGLVNAAKNI